MATVPTGGGVSRCLGSAQRGPSGRVTEASVDVRASGLGLKDQRELASKAAEVSKEEKRISPTLPPATA